MSVGVMKDYQYFELQGGKLILRIFNILRIGRILSKLGGFPLFLLDRCDLCFVCFLQKSFLT